MLFSSITFLFAFLPLVLVCYYVSPRKIRNLILLIFSLLFYAWGEPKYILVMSVSILVGYLSGLLTEKLLRQEKRKAARAAMLLSVAVNLGILLFFKYSNFFISNINHVFGTEMKLLEIALPLGISFYTFQILSYSVDVYRGEVRAQKNLIHLAAYITLFPQLIAGPIVRYQTVAEQLTERKESFDHFGEGAKRFVTGLGKKVLLANTIGEVFSQLSVLPPDQNSVVLSWLCSFAFTFQIYFDFSGYSDMAIGLGRMFGFEFLENFNYPYISKSITEFWRRWHISLSTWFRDYVYIPLGGNRRGKLRTLFNIFLVWLLTGFWHGAAWNFIVWGLYYFLLLMIEKNGFKKILDKAPGILSRVYTLFFVNLGWVIFAYDDMKNLSQAVKNMFGFGNLAFINDTTWFYLISYGILFVLAAAGSTTLPARLGKRVLSFIAGVKENGENKEEEAEGEKGMTGRETTATVIMLLFLFGVMTLSVAGLASDAFNPFLYFRF